MPFLSKREREGLYKSVCRSCFDKYGKVADMEITALEGIWCLWFPRKAHVPHHSGPHGAASGGLVRRLGE